MVGDRSGPALHALESKGLQEAAPTEVAENVVEGLQEEEEALERIVDGRQAGSVVGVY